MVALEATAYDVLPVSAPALLSYSRHPHIGTHTA